MRDKARPPFRRSFALAAVCCHRHLVPPRHATSPHCLAGPIAACDKAVLIRHLRQILLEKTEIFG